MARGKTITLKGPALKAFMAMYEGPPKTERARLEQYATAIFMALSEERMDKAVAVLLEFRSSSPIVEVTTPDDRPPTPDDRPPTPEQKLAVVRRARLKR